MIATQPALLEDTLELQFQQWIREAPDVVDAVRRLAVRWHQAGHDRCGIGMLTEVVRWDAGIKGTGDGFKIDNSLRALLARHILATTPELPSTFFQLRVRPSSWKASR